MSRPVKTESSLLGDGTHAFDHLPTTRLVFGVGTLERLGDLTAELGVKRVLIVTDPGIRSAGHVDRAVASLSAANLAPFVFDAVEENPTTRHVEHCVDVAKEHKIDAIVGLGGGSSMDTAKGANFLLTNGGRMQDYWGIGKATKPMLPLVAVPTTAGTGSEAQSFALIADEKTHQKMACGDKKAAATIAILDPALTVTQPPRVTALVGIDAVAHALESHVTRKRNPLSRLYSTEAWRLLSEGLPRVLADPADLEARAAMQLGANFAGAAIEASMLGAAHASANPLTSRFGVTHGLAVGLMLPHVIRYNAADEGTGYADLEGAPGAAREVGEWLAAKVTHFLRLADLPTTLDDVNVTRSDVSRLAEEAAQQWTAQFNPRPIAVHDFETLYRGAFKAAMESVA
ncbi:NAD-dependent methanol dehydrogenase [Planctomycetes bacterium Pan216]|uniref:NAD-dependent methanol dehydrogenase n=1 Tax=Kolteria novifilia TaxID=2527975 RepID=A0A518B305_9BACT|nr:NAD-dependent methanol dehydrogenase [Planctomycetes bacterium Pan216]